MRKTRCLPHERLHMPPCGSAIHTPHVRVIIHGQGRCPGPGARTCQQWRTQTLYSVFSVSVYVCGSVDIERERDKAIENERRKRDSHLLTGVQYHPIQNGSNNTRISNTASCSQICAKAKWQSTTNSQIQTCEWYTSTKEPYTSTKEPCTFTKKTCISTKEPTYYPKRDLWSETNS